MPTDGQTDRQTGAAAPDGDGEILTIAAAAERLGISKNAVWMRIQRGTLTKVACPESDANPAAACVIVPPPGSRRRPAKRQTERPTATDRPTAKETDRPTGADQATDRGTDRPTGAAAVVDERDIRLAALEAEIQSLWDQRAYLKDQMERERDEHREAVAAVREDHRREVDGIRADHQREVDGLSAVIAGYRRDIEALTDAVGDRNDLVRAASARILPAQLLDAVPTGNAPQGPPEALERTDPPFSTRRTLKDHADDLRRAALRAVGIGR